jgi:hypothetical protein
MGQVLRDRHQAHDLSCLHYVETQICVSSCRRLNRNQIIIFLFFLLSIPIVNGKDPFYYLGSGRHLSTELPICFSVCFFQSIY